MNFIKEKGYKILLFIMLILWGYITYSTIFHIYPANYHDQINFSKVVLILGTIILLLFLLAVYKAISKLKEKKHDLIAIILCIISFIFMCYFALNYKTTFRYDLNHIEDIVEILINNKTMTIGESKYLSVYPFQFPLVALVYFIEKIGTIFNNPSNAMIIYNCIMISLSSFFIYKIIKEIFNSKLALIGLILMLLTPDFYLFSSYYYTDITCIPYCIIGFYFLIKSLNNNKKLYQVISGIMFAIAFKLRIVCIIILISYMICNFFHENIKNNIKKYSTFIISFIVAILTITYIILPQFKFNKQSDLTFPATHWLMMGANTKEDGGYIEEDYEKTFIAKDKNKYINKELKERLKDVNIKFYLTKLRRVWSEGDHDINNQYKGQVTKLDLYKYIDGNASSFLRYFQQISLITIYVLFLITIITEIIHKETLDKSKNSIYIICIFGAILFYLFWEAKVRYSFTFIPWIIVSGVISLNKINDLLNSNIKTKISFNNIKKIVAVLILVLTVTYLGLSFKKYSLTKSNQSEVTFSQNDLNNYVGIANNVIRLEFDANKPFNQIEFSFNIKGNKKDLKYTFILYDGTTKIYTKEFDIEWAIQKDIAIFDIPEQNIKTKKTYNVIIYSEEATMGNYLTIGVSMIDYCKDKIIYTENNGYDINPNSNSYSNNKIMCPEIRYQLINYKNKEIVNKKVFIVFASSIIIITSFSLYYGLIKEVKVEKEKQSTRKKSKNVV